VKGSRLLFALVLTGLGACIASADGVDPTVVIRRVDPTPFPITSPNETFPLFATATNNIFAFQNDTGVTLDSLTLDLFGVGVTLSFSCGALAGGDVFSTCTSTPGSHGDTILTFSGVGGSFTGITAATCSSEDDGEEGSFFGDDLPTCTGGIFSLEFGGIPTGDVVGGTGTVSTPEPMTAVLLVGGGLAGLAGLRKRRAA